MLRDLLTFQQHYWWWTEPQHQSAMARRDKWVTEFGLAAEATALACPSRGVRKYRLLDQLRTIDCDRGVCALSKRHDGAFKFRVACPDDVASCRAENY